MALVTDQSSPQKQSFWDRPIFATLTINWEMVLYGLIVMVAFVTRFYILGDRVMSHDESLHALFSYKLYEGEGYKHDPLMHGPFQFHIVALSYLLFGDNDFSARIPAALFGVALVVLPYWFRPWLGRLGALVTSLGLLISPSLLYYQRYIRNESFIVFLTALMALSLFQYMRIRHKRWLYWGAAAISLSLSSKEVAYIHGFIGVLFIAGALLWEGVSLKRFRTLQWVLLSLMVILLALALLLTNASAEQFPFTPAKMAGVLMLVAGLTAALLSISRNVDRRHTPVSAAISSFKEDPVGLLSGPVAVAVAIFVLLYTTFFTNPAGLISGTWGALSYWLKQQDVARGGQPGYYYLMLMSLYEFLPFVIGLVGGIVYLIKGAPSHLDPAEVEAIEAAGKKRAGETDEKPTSPLYPSDGGTFAAYLVVWTISSFVIYSWAGEKMPWLNTHVVLPFIFLLGHISQTALKHFDWRIFRTRAGLLFTILLPLFAAALLALFSLWPFQGQSLNALRQTSQFLMILLVVIAIGFGLWVYGRRLAAKQIKPILYLAALSLLTILTIRFAWLSSFVNYDLVNEFLVYAHAAPDVKWVLNEVDDISRRTVGDKQIKLAYGGVIWPLEWYMRDYPNRAFFGSSPNREALDAPVIIFSPDAEVSLEEVEPFLGDNYQRFRYRQVWWPLEDYKDQSFRRLWNTYVVPDPASGATMETIRQNWQSLWNVLFYRHNDYYALSEWPFMTRMYFYVRKDVLNELWDYRTGPLTEAEVPVDPYAEVRQTLPALQVWGSEGSTDGRFLQPRAMTISPQGQVYVADGGNHRIQVFDQAGNFLKAWGGAEGPEPGQLTEPWGIAVSEDGRVYVADTWNHRVQVFDENGNYLSEFGAFANTNGEAQILPGAFWGPRGIALDKEGNVYVADTGNKRVQKFTPDGVYLGAWGGGGVVPGRFEEPTSLAIDQEGHIYVADTWNQRVQKFDADFNFITEWPVAGWESEDVLNKPFIIVDSQNRVYVSDPENYRIVVYDANGQLLGVFGQYGQDLASFKLPLGLAVGEGDILFVLDSENNRVMKFAFQK